MARLFVLVFGMLLAAPFWLQFIFAGGMAYFGYTLQEKHAERIAHRAELLQSEPPATIDIAAFDTDYSSSTPTEVSVSAQVAIDHNTKLIHKTNFITTSENVLYVLVDADAPANETVARGAIVIDPDQVDTLVEYLGTRATGFGDGGPVATIDGLLDSGTDNSMVSDALKEQGMTKGPNFFYIEPFFEGREAGLAVKPNEARGVAMPFYYGALIFVLFGCFKAFVARRKAKRGPVASAPVPAQPAEVAPAGAPALDPSQIWRRNTAEPAMPAKRQTWTDGEYAHEEPAPQAAAAPKTMVEKILSMGKIKLGLLAVVAIGGLQMLGSQAISGLLPLLILGLIYFGFYKASTKFRSTVGTVVDSVADKVLSRNTGAADTPAAAQFTPSASVTPKARDKFASSPIKSGGFSFSDLMPQRKAKPMPGPDPFDRLAERVRAERLKQSQG